MGALLGFCERGVPRFFEGRKCFYEGLWTDVTTYVSVLGIHLCGEFSYAFKRHPVSSMKTRKIAEARFRQSLVGVYLNFFNLYRSNSFLLKLLLKRRVACVYFYVNIRFIAYLV